MSNVTSPMEHHDKLWAEVQSAHSKRLDHKSPETEAAFYQAHAKWMRFYLMITRSGPETYKVPKCQ